MPSWLSLIEEKEEGDGIGIESEPATSLPSLQIVTVEYLDRVGPYPWNAIEDFVGSRKRRSSKTVVLEELTLTGVRGSLDQGELLRSSVSTLHVLQTYPLAYEGVSGFLSVTIAQLFCH